MASHAIYVLRCGSGARGQPDDPRLRLVLPTIHCQSFRFLRLIISVVCHTNMRHHRLPRVELAAPFCVFFSDAADVERRSSRPAC